MDHTWYNMGTGNWGQLFQMEETKATNLNISSKMILIAMVPGVEHFLHIVKPHQSTSYNLRYLNHRTLPDAVETKNGIVS